MEKKYIIDLPENTHWVQWIMEGTKDHHPYMDFKQVEDLTPYIEPDIEKIRKEAYEDGYNRGKHDAKKAFEVYAGNAYQRGMEDAWEATRKIASDNAGRNYSIFGQHFTAEILNTHSASEAIEEIRAYEQAQKEKEEQESITTENVMRQYLDTFCTKTYCAVCPLYTPDFTCGRGYSFLTNNRVSDEEVRRAYAVVLQKMKE